MKLAVSILAALAAVYATWELVVVILIENEIERFGKENSYSYWYPDKLEIKRQTAEMKCVCGLAAAVAFAVASLLCY